MKLPYRFFIDYVGPAADDYELYVVEWVDLKIFRAWKPGAEEISSSDLNEYAYWIPVRAAAEGRSWRGGFPPRPDNRQSATSNGSVAIKGKVSVAIEDGRVATAQLMDRWARVNPAALSGRTAPTTLQPQIGESL